MLKEVTTPIVIDRTAIEFGVIVVTSAFLEVVAMVTTKRYAVWV